MPETLDISALPTLGALGFTGGRDSFRAFVRRIFAPGQPRYARTDQGLPVVLRHADLTAFGTSPRVGSVPPGVLFPGRLDAAPGTPAPPGTEIARVLSTQVFTNNPPIHGATRRILMNWIGPRQIAALEPLVRDLAADLVSRLAPTEADFVTLVAEALTVGFWSRLLQLTGPETRGLAQAAQEMTRLFVFNRQIDDLVALDQTFRRYADILQAAGARGLDRGDPALVEIEAQRQTLDFAEDIHTVGVLPKTLGEFLAGNLIDGVHTAALATANTCFALSRHPAAMQQLQADPALLPKAIAEALRLEPPVIFLKRYVLEDFEHDGDIFRAGQQVVMMWGAGNHDPAAFPDPERFDLTRRQQGLTTFGLGAHICPGRYVGVMLTRILLEELLAAGLSFHPAATPALWLDDHVMCQLHSLPLALSRP